MWKIPDIVEIQRGLNNITDDGLNEFVNNLETHEIKWVLMSYLKQFLPHPAPKKAKRCTFPKMNKLHSQRLNNIENNALDKSILCQMKHYLVHNLYYNPNSSIKTIPLSVNSINNSQNKCNLIKTIPKSLLAHIISFLSFSERVTCCHVSYSIYQAANESTAMTHLKLTSKWFIKSQFHEKFDIYQYSDFKNIIFDHPCCYHEKIAKPNFDKNFCARIIKTMSKASKITIADTFFSLNNVETYWSCRNIVRYISLMNINDCSDVMKIKDNIRWLSIKNNYLYVRVSRYNEDCKDANQLCSLITNCVNLNKLSINFDCWSDVHGKRSTRYDTLNNLYVPIVKQFANTILCNKILISRIKYLDFDDRFRYDYDINVDSNNILLYNIDKFVNIETLKLRLSFPAKKIDNGDFIEYKDISVLNLTKITQKNVNKLFRLTDLTLIWYELEKPSQHLVQVSGNTIGLNKTCFIRQNNVMFGVIDYIFSLAQNVKQFRLSCPQLMATIQLYVGSEVIRTGVHSLISSLINRTFVSKQESERKNTIEILELPIDCGFISFLNKALVQEYGACDGNSNDNGSDNSKCNLKAITLLMDFCQWNVFNDILTMIEDTSKIFKFGLKTIR